jgi:hypothetical protein
LQLSFDHKIKDTLKPSTQSSFNFGQSIADNNEGNALYQFKYIFLLDYIDSLVLGGENKRCLSKEVDAFVSVMLMKSMINSMTRLYLIKLRDTLPILLIA